MGYVLLEGGAEFGGRMADPDRAALAQAGGPEARVRIIPAAAAPDHNEARAGRNAVRWFRGLGARNVDVVPLNDRASADDATVAHELTQARLIYLLGGFTHHLGQALADSRSAAALRTAYAAGAVLAGSSAGAMVLCEHYYDPASQTLFAGLGYVRRACVIPHHDTFGRGWAARLTRLLPDSVLVGIDEQTGMLADEAGRTWQVSGRGVVTLYWGGQTQSFTAGTRFDWPLA